MWFHVKSQTSQVNLLRFRDATGASVGYVYIETTGQLGFHNDATSANILSATVPSAGWHALELHVLTGGAAGAVELWLDNVRVDDLSGPATTLANPVGGVQIGEAQTTNQVYDVVFDDFAFGTSRLGPVAGGGPTAPSNLTATASSPYGSVSLTWTASTSTLGIAGYDIYRDGAPVASLGNVLAYTDSSVLPSTTYTYTVQGRDLSGASSAASAPASATTPAAPTPTFADGFESGSLGLWSAKSGLTVQGTTVHGGAKAAEGTVTAAPAYGKATVTAAPDAYARVWFQVKSQASQVTLLRMRDTANGTSVGGYVYLTTGGNLGFHNDATNTSTTDTTTQPGPGWHALELHVLTGSSGTVEVWLDGTWIAALSATAVNTGASSIGVLQIGDTANVTYDVVFDDVAFGTSRLGPVAGGGPTAPTNLNATASNPYGSVSLTWTASTSTLGIAGYDIFRDGAPVASLGNVLAYTDSSVLPSTTYSYTVQARDTSGASSAPSAPASATTPAAAAPLFADGFESGTSGAWTSSVGLVIENTIVHGGTYAAEGSTTTGSTYVRQSISGSPSSVYARVWFDLASQANNNVTLLGFRSGGSLVGSVYVGSTGKLGVVGSTGTGSTTFGSTTGPSLGVWHALEFHFTANGASSTTEVWLDGALVGDLSQTVYSTVSSVDTLQVGDNQTGRTYDVVYDDAAYGASRLGPTADSGPTAPTNVSANASSAFSVDLGWTASSSGIGIADYDVYRDGSLAAGHVTGTSWTDSTVLPSTTYSYTVQARDTAGGLSAMSSPASATTPAAPVPSTPTNVNANATGPYSVDLTWGASTSDLGIADYDIYRDGNLAAGHVSGTSWTDSTAQPSTTYSYEVQARDTAGGLSAKSAPASATTPALAAPIFSDGFESGDLSNWSGPTGLTVENTTVHTGSYAVEANTTNGGTYAKETLPGTYTDAYARIAFLVKSQGATLNMLRLRDSGGASIGYLYLTTTAGGQLAFHNDATSANTLSATVPSQNVWHVLELHLSINGASSTVEVWLDGALVSDLSSSGVNLGTAPVGQLQLGETQKSGRTYDVFFDDVAFGTSRLGQ